MDGIIADRDSWIERSRIRICYIHRPMFDRSAWCNWFHCRSFLVSKGFTLNNRSHSKSITCWSGSCQVDVRHFHESYQVFRLSIEWNRKGHTWRYETVTEQNWKPQIRIHLIYNSLDVLTESLREDVNSDLQYAVDNINEFVLCRLDSSSWYRSGIELVCTLTFVKCAS